MMRKKKSAASQNHVMAVCDDQGTPRLEDNYYKQFRIPQTHQYPKKTQKIKF